VSGHLLRRGLGAALAIGCAVSIALAPVAAPIHQAFADHRHVYCPEHQCYEDAGPRDAACVAPDPEGAAVAGQHATGERAACDLSNFLIQAAPAARALPCACELGANERSEGRVAFAPPAPIALRHLAPKHSPPALA
jgi:hypothetical protein